MNTCSPIPSNNESSCDQYEGKRVKYVIIAGDNADLSGLRDISALNRMIEDGTVIIRGWEDVKVMQEEIHEFVSPAMEYDGKIDLKDIFIENAYYEDLPPIPARQIFRQRYVPLIAPTGSKGLGTGCRGPPCFRPGDWSDGRSNYLMKDFYRPLAFPGKVLKNK